MVQDPERRGIREDFSEEVVFAIDPEDGLGLQLLD